MKTLGNLIWIIFGGLFVALEYLLSSVALMVTIIGIPFGIQTLKMAALAIWPFGKKIVVHERSGGLLRIVFNILWIIMGGFWIAVTHLIFAAFFCITIVGIPFARQHLKLAGLALTPFGRDVVSS